jgi:hypothetical protein
MIFLFLKFNTNFKYLDIIIKFGRGCPKVIEPQGLTVNRVYAILWKKQSLDTAELARMRVEEGLGSRVIAQRLGVPRSTVIGAIHRLERKR